MNPPPENPADKVPLEVPIGYVVRELWGERVVVRDGAPWDPGAIYPIPVPDDTFVQYSKRIEQDIARSFCLPAHLIDPFAMLVTGV